MDDLWNSGVLSVIRFAYWIGLGTCDALFCVSHILQSASQSGQPSCRLYRLISKSSVQPSIGSTMEFSMISALTELSMYWRFRVVYTETVSMKLIRAWNSGWLSELTG